MGWRGQGGSRGFGLYARPAGKTRRPPPTDWPRAALRFQAAGVAEDLMAPLRRQLKS